MSRAYALFRDQSTQHTLTTSPLTTSIRHRTESTFIIGLGRAAVTFETGQVEANIRVLIQHVKSTA